MNSVQWIERIKAAGWGEALSSLLDAIAPVGVVAAQIGYAAQPLARIFGDSRGELSALARLLETPEGIAALRAMLESPPHDEER